MRTPQTLAPTLPPHFARTVSTQSGAFPGKLASNVDIFVCSRGAHRAANINRKGAVIPAASFIKCKEIRRPEAVVEMDTLIVKSRAVRLMLNCGQRRLCELPNSGKFNYFPDSRQLKTAVVSINRHIKRGLGKNIENKAAP